MIELTPLEKAIVQVESGGKLDAIGDRHLFNKAFGPMQIRKPCVDDVNRVFGTTYKAEDCLNNLEISVDIFRKYMEIWATPKRIIREKGIVTDMDKARIWNFGPRGWANPRSMGYWKKVEKALLAQHS